jgi:alpha-beta hydrolase superfamily lysophospholipase
MPTLMAPASPRSRARRWILAALLGTAALGLGLVVAVGWLGSNQALRPPWYQRRTLEQGLVPMDPAAAFFIWRGGYRDPRTDLGLDYETVEFPARDGSTLRGWFVPGEPGATAGVVAVHGAGADRREFLRQVPVFHRAGYPVLLFDCREQGISDGAGRGISLGTRESEDVTAAVAWAKLSRGLARVAVIGTSQGAASVILAAASDPAIDVVIAENSFTSIRELVRDVGGLQDVRPIPGWATRVVAAFTLWRVGGWGQPAPIDVVAAIAPRPLLLMHGTKDAASPYAHSQRLREAAREPVELWILEGAEHAALFNRAPEEWERRVIGFLARWLGPAKAG